MNYEALLKRYMAYLSLVEGYDFVHADPSDYRVGDFTDEEKAELLRLSMANENG